MRMILLAWILIISLSIWTTPLDYVTLYTDQDVFRHPFTSMNKTRSLCAQLNCRWNFLAIQDSSPLNLSEPHSGRSSQPTLLVVLLSIGDSLTIRDRWSSSTFGVETVFCQVHCTGRGWPPWNVW
ncbi:hypothetical protein P692DRAFT_20852801 [Suillus brevipes Sb2]|nr:hypothetical protein P692DRAFT_20852801 [Suillus brevipes Sb2]